jgi:hypothetical protein
MDWQVIEFTNQGAKGVRSKYAAVYIIVDELAHALFQDY